MCHLELDPVWPGLTASCMQSDGAQKVSLGSGHVDGGGGGGQISVITHWPRQDAASQAELPLGSPGSVGQNNFYAPMNNSSAFHFKYSGARCSFFFSSFC